MRRIPASLLCATVALLPASLLAAPASSSATTPGENSRIAFSADFGQGFELYTVRPDGAGLRQVTEGERDAVHPDWSPDGRQITFGIESEEHEGVGLMGRNGAHLRDLTPTGFQGQPAFTPDGRHIVFSRPARKHPGIWIMRTDGSHLRELTDPPTGIDGDTDPNVSPDGKVISFVRIKAEGETQALFSVHRDGTHLRRLTPYSLEVAIKHDWAPDGQHIVLTTNADFVHKGQSANLATIRPDGSDLTMLTDFKGGEVNAFAGSYSPDGEWIAFRFEDHGRYDVSRIRPDGRDRRTILSFPVAPRFIDWGPRPH